MNPKTLGAILVAVAVSAAGAVELASTECVDALGIKVVDGT